MTTNAISRQKPGPPRIARYFKSGNSLSSGGNYYGKTAYAILLILLISGIQDVYGQRSCKVRSSRGKGGASASSSSVFMQITDETNGRVVTYEKEFKLDHIPAHLRDRYIEHLEDSLLYADTGSFYFINNKNPKPARQPSRTAPQKNNVRKSSRIAGIR